jgi:FMN-dependent NADH-azoreductase
MPTLLRIDSSPRSASISTKLTGEFVEKWKQQHPDGRVIHHNTTIENLPFVDESTIGAFYTPDEARSSDQKKLLALSDKLVDELIAAEVVVFGVPMWNFGIPASLKAWVDLIVRVGRTFARSANGYASLLPAGKKAYIFTARGGSYAAGTPFNAFDHQEPYLRSFLGFLGIHDVTFIHAENQSRGEEASLAGVTKAEEEIAALAV